MILGFLGSSWFCDRYNWNESVPVCQVWFMHIFIHAMSVVHWSQDASKCWASRYSKIFWAFLGGFWSHSICINLMVKSGEIGGMHPESQHGPARRCWRSTASHEGQSKNFKHHRTPQTQANDSKWWHAWSADVHRYTMIHKPYHNHPQSSCCPSLKSSCVECRLLNGTRWHMPTRVRFSKWRGSEERNSWRRQTSHPQAAELWSLWEVAGMHQTSD